MPYGSKGTATNAIITMVHKSPGESQTLVHTQEFHGLSDDYWTRSGTNRNPSTFKMCTPYTGPMQTVSRRLPLGPRLPYKVFSKKANRLVWAREYITVYKSVPAKTKTRAAKGLDLMPNALNYFSKRVQPILSPSLFGRYDNDWQESYSGSTWCSFTPVNGSQPIPIGPNDSDLLRSETEALVARADAKALPKLYEKAKNQHVNLLNALAERRQTVKLLVDTSARLIKVLRSLRRGNVPGAVTQLFSGLGTAQGISSGYLAYVYGVKPLVDDINGIIKHLNEWESLVFDVKVGATEGYDAVPEVAQTFNGIAVKCKNYYSGKVSVTYKARVRSKDNFNRNLARLGFTNLPATAWEVIPFSFIVDWVIPIGNYLNNVDAFEHLEIVYCTKTVFSKEYSVYTREFGGRDNYGYTWATANAGCVVTKVKCVRELLPSAPVLNFPYVKDPFGSRQHIYNLLALIASFHR